MALKNLTDDATKSKITKWLVDSQNNVNMGLWEILINSSSSGTCKLNINGAIFNISLNEGQNSESIGLKFPSSETINVSLNCSLVQEAKIVHTYFGRAIEIPLQKEDDVFKTALNNRKCWGSSFRGECEATSTAFAILALKDLNSDADLLNATTWLNANAQLTQEKALAYLFSKDPVLESWLINNQAPSGFWSEGAIALNNKSDAQSTIFASYCLKNLSDSKQEVFDALSKAKIWLQEQEKNNFNNSILNQASYLFFIYPMSQIEPVMSVDDGIKKEVSNRVFSITLRNKGILPLDVNLSISDLGIKQNLSLAVGDFKSPTILIPARSDNLVTSLDIDYSTKYGNARKYNIPLIIFASGTSNQIISGSGVLLPTSLIFLETEINKSFANDKNSLIEVHLKNNARFSVYNISIIPSFSLNEIVSVVNFSLPSIASGENKTILLNVTALGAIPTEYNGNVQAETTEGVIASLPVSIKITSNITQTNKTCSQLNCTVCKDNELCSVYPTITSDTTKCCCGTCSKITPQPGKNTGKIIGIVMIGVAILIIFLFLTRKPKRPKSEMKEIIEKIEEKYKK